MPTPNNKHWILPVTETTQLTVTLPQELLDLADIREGDEIECEVEDGRLVLRPVRYEELELELSDDNMLKLCLLAHQENLTLNQLVNKILEEIVRQGGV